MIQPTLINSNPNEYSEEFHYYPFAVKLDRCVGSLMEENVIHINGGITINIDMSVNVMYLKKSSMYNKVKDIDLKNQSILLFQWYYQYKKFWSKFETDGKTYEDVFIYCVGYVTIKYSKYVKIKCVNPLYFIFIKVNWYFEEISGNKYLTLVPTNESKEKFKKYEELRIKIKYLIRSMTKNSDDYDQKYMKIKFK